MNPEIKKYGSNLVLNQNVFMYDEKLQLNVLNGVRVVSRFDFQDSTRKTDTIEIGDPDEIFGATGLTETLEPSDPDEIYADATTITRMQEQSDPDEIFACSTQATKAAENSDPDELISLPVM